MKLFRFGERGREEPGIVAADGTLCSLVGVIPDIDGAALSPEALEALRGRDTAALPPVPEGARIGSCVGGVGKLIGIGLNYSDHAEESGLPIPKEPIVFLKANTSIAGPYDEVVLPPDAKKADWEVELAFVIGTRAKHVAEADAMAHVAGYCIVNDISERAWQAEREGQWTKGKSYDGFAPMGPWLVTADEIADPGNLRMTCDVSGDRRQDGSTSTMIFGIATLVSYLSQFMTLEPGDVVTTGTPPGVGLGMRPQVWLKDGDVMRLEVAGLGHQEQAVRVAAP
ncbi:fumarylacetoacetate hydrolase family protein [Roseovarius indicus]|uniref:fumarylacetoacetate hydrolase family protein n=1 Tax=Roseovarius indicus TaxID=540747 RepID=UPI0007D9F75B|nr:fumarylacetoacetate hydrolase family protein [Roseovarius indicus]OAN99011.1 2-hydroxyhepta-2,4-diene-1,7-dioate isomerase [Roseovarius indicus]